MSEALGVIEAKYKELMDVFKKQSDYLSQLNAQLKQLRIDRKTTLAKLNETSGALQAYGSVVNLMKPPAAAVEESTCDVYHPPAEPVVVDAVAEPVQ